MNQKGFSPLIVIFGVLILIGVAAGSYYLGTRNNKESSSNLSVSSSVPAPTNIPSPISSPSASVTPASVYEKRLFEPTKPFFDNKLYPSELTSISENDLVGLNCSPGYQGDYNGGYFTYDSKTQKQIKLQDEQLLSIISSLNTPDNYISAVMKCTTEDQRTFVEYEIWGGGGGMNNTAHIALINNKDNVNIATIPNDGVAYFGCRVILQLTTNGDMYVGCGGGDGGAGGASIYSVNLNNKQLIQVQKCFSSPEKTECTKN